MNGKFSSVYRNILSSKFKIILLSSVIFSFIAHGFVFNNFAPQGDGVIFAFSMEEQNRWFISLGRFLLPLDTVIRGNMVQPLFAGILSTFYIAVSAYFICECLEFHEKYQWILTAGFMCVNLSLADLYTNYERLVPPFMFAVLMVTGSTLLLLKKQGWKAILVSSVLYGLSMGFYQAQIVFALLIMDLILMQMCLQGKDIKEILRVAGRFLISLLLAGVLYYCLNHAIQSYMNISAPHSYNSMSGLASLEFWQLVSDVKANIFNYLSYYLGKGCFLGLDLRIADIILTVITAFLTVRHLILHHEEISFLHILFLIIDMGLFVVCSLLMATLMREEYIRFYVSYAICMFYPALMFFMDQTAVQLKDKHKNAIQTVTAVCAFIVLFRTSVFTNELYTNQKILYDRTVSLTTQIMSDLNHEEGYVPAESKVLFIGRLYRNENLQKLGNTFDEFKTPYSEQHRASATYTDALVDFVKMMGFDVNSIEDPQILSEYERSSEVQSMPSFPQNGYIMQKDGYYIVKVSAWDPDE
ncbi:MAG: glucosyltransferase domain-containing protein [Bulleidia sp.]|nr:glucosyltransferase domain-containing protein [Bulleidia sp.]